MKYARALKVAALVFPGAAVAILLLFALGETVEGDWSGLGHLVQAIPVGLGMWLGWKRPLWGGLFFLVLSLLALNSFVSDLRGADWLAPLLIIVVPLFLSGVLSLSAAGLEKKMIQH
jgi:hypothetical protein